MSIIVSSQLFSDAWFVAGMNEYLRIRFADVKQNTNANTFVYLFAHRGEFSLTEFFGGGSRDFGVCHGDDIQYLFPFLKEFFVSTVPSKKSTEVRKAMTKLWVDFAKTGYVIK